MGQTPLPPAHQQPQQQPQIICPPNNGPTPRQTNGPQASVYSFFITLFHVAFSLFFSLSFPRNPPLVSYVREEIEAFGESATKKKKERGTFAGSNVVGTTILRATTTRQSRPDGTHHE